jgi:transposase InsO family protein
MASSGVTIVVALQISTRSLTYSVGTSGLDSPHGGRKFSVGRGADRQRAIAQTRLSNIAAHGPQVHAEAATRSSPRRSRLGNFLHNHAKAILACDFLVTVTATFRLVYVLVVIHHESRRLLHVNVTCTPTAAWTLQQLREAINIEDLHRYLIHDRDGIFSRDLDRSINSLGLKVLKSQVHSPKANGICERDIGTVRRECLDWLIPVSEAHLRMLLKEWATHYNEGRPHMALGPGIPSPPREKGPCNNGRLRRELCGR